MASALDILDDLAPISELSNTGTTISNEEVMLDLGISPSDLAEAPEPELA